jgi:hypothetical protein
VPWDRTTGVIGRQGSGKTLDLLAPALLQAPGAALVTLTKVDDLLLSFAARSRGDRPCVVLDPFGLAVGLPELVWDPVAGCADSMVAERRAKAFTAGTVKGAVAGGYGDDAARFYAAEAAKVIQAFLHAAGHAGEPPRRDGARATTRTLWLACRPLLAWLPAVPGSSTTRRQRASSWGTSSPPIQDGLRCFSPQAGWSPRLVHRWRTDRPSPASTGFPP